MKEKICKYWVFSGSLLAVSLLGGLRPDKGAAETGSTGDTKAVQEAD